MPLTAKEVEDIAVTAAVRAAERSAEEAANQAAEKIAMTRSELNDVVASAVKQTLLQLGVDTSDPIAMQRDFQHLRQWRESGEDLKRKGMLVVLGIFLSGLGTLILLGFSEWFKK